MGTSNWKEAIEAINMLEKDYRAFKKKLC